VPTTLAGVTVTINNVKAPLIFVSPTQINAIVPYEVAGQTTANVVISLNDATSTGTPVQVVPTAPSIFTLSQTGRDQGAILNQNGSVNGTSNPAAKGSIIQIFGTDGGTAEDRLALAEPTHQVESSREPVILNGVVVIDDQRRGEQGNDFRRIAHAAIL